MERDELSGEIIGAAIDVHRELGPGLLESAYETCLAHELSVRDIPVETQVPLPIEYKEVTIDCGYRLDLVVDDDILVELKAVDDITDVHRAQVISYLRFCETDLGLLINFNVPLLKNGVCRIVDDQHRENRHTQT